MAVCGSSFKRLRSRSKTNLPGLVLHPVLTLFFKLYIIADAIVPVSCGLALTKKILKDKLVQKIEEYIFMVSEAMRRDHLIKG